MDLVRWNPFRGIFRKDDLYEGDEWMMSGRTFMPKVDVFEKDGRLNLHAELPGLKKEDVNITISDRVLTIEGSSKIEREEKKKNYYYSERSSGSFKRSFALPEDVGAEDIKASFEDGILKVTLPSVKKEVKKIDIN